MKNKKHKIFLYPVEENGMIKVLLFQSGDIGIKRGDCEEFTHRGYEVCSATFTAANNYGNLFVNGSRRSEDFMLNKITESFSYTEEQFQKLKELERAYNNRI